MKLIIIYFFINIIALILASLTDNSKRSHSKKHVVIKRPYITRPTVVARPIAYTRPYIRTSPVLLRRPVFAVVRTQIEECPLIKGNKELVGKSTGKCKSPCSISACIQTSSECCFYSKQ